MPHCENLDSFSVYFHSSNINYIIMVKFSPSKGGKKMVRVSEDRDESSNQMTDLSYDFFQ
jgi:hypothetical protein